MVAATALNVGAISPLPARGEAGIDGMLPEQTAALRENEERLGAAEVGVEAVEFLDYRDGVVEYGLPLRRRCSRRRQQVDLPDLLDEGPEPWPGVRYVCFVATGEATSRVYRRADRHRRWERRRGANGAAARRYQLPRPPPLIPQQGTRPPEQPRVTGTGWCTDDHSRFAQRQGPVHRHRCG